MGARRGLARRAEPAPGNILKSAERPSLIVAFECPICGDDVGDPQDGFLSHMRASEDCRVAYEHQSETTAAEWSRR